MRFMTMVTCAENSESGRPRSEHAAVGMWIMRSSLVKGTAHV